MNEYTYTIFNIIFFGLTVPAIFIYRKLVIKKMKFILISGFVGALYFFTVDLQMTKLKAWEYDYSKTLGIRFDFAIVEELIWMILVFMLVAVAIEVYFYKIEKHRNNPMQKITILIGLPGSGKSTYILNNKETLKNTVVCDDYHKSLEIKGHSRLFKDSIYFNDLRKGLAEGKNVLIADIGYCKQERLEQIKKDIEAILADLNIKAVTKCVYFENNPEKCKQNIIHRDRNDRVKRELEYVDTFSSVYYIPEGEKVISIVTKY